MKERNGLTLADVLLVVFIILKLCGVVNWSWWWVLSPVWISLIIVIICYLIQEKQNERKKWFNSC